MIRKSGLENGRDFQVGLEQAWHNQTIVKDRIIMEDLPEIVAEQVYFGDDFTPIKGLFIPVSLDDLKPCGRPFNVDTYSLFTPRAAWSCTHEILSGTGFRVESVGMLSDRTRWFLSIHLSELADVTPAGDKSKTKFQLNFSGGLDGSMSPQAELSATRIVCRNTLNISRATGQVLFKSKATKNFKNRLDLAKSEIEKAVGMSRIFAETLSSLNSIPATRDTAKEIYAGFVTPLGEKRMSTRAKNLTGELADLFATGDGNYGRTMGDVLNGFTQARTRGIQGSSKDVWSTFESSETGLFADQKAEFFNLLVDSGKRETTRERGAQLITDSIG